MKFYLTTAIDYVNGAPHLGHAYEKVGTDALARFHRQRGDDVFFLTGADENSDRNVDAAKAQGITTQAFVERNSVSSSASATPFRSRTTASSARRRRGPQEGRSGVRAAVDRERRCLFRHLRGPVLPGLRGVLRRRRARRRPLPGPSDATGVPAARQRAELLLPPVEVREEAQGPYASGRTSPFPSPAATRSSDGSTVV